MKNPLRVVLPWLTAMVTVAGTSAGADGLYGRLDGELELRAAAGATLRPQGPNDGMVRLSTHYLQTLGLFGSVGHSPRSDDPFSFDGGVSLQPLFFPRWTRDLERGPAWLDLAIDSLAIEAGLYQRPGNAAGTQDRGWEVGVVLQAPLAGTHAGPWVGVRASRHYSYAWDLDSAPDPWSAQLWVAFPWMLAVPWLAPEAILP